MRCGQLRGNVKLALPTAQAPNIFDTRKRQKEVRHLRYSYEDNRISLFSGRPIPSTSPTPTITDDGCTLTPFWHLLFQRTAPGSSGRGRFDTHHNRRRRPISLAPFFFFCFFSWVRRLLRADRPPVLAQWEASRSAASVPAFEGQLVVNRKWKQPPRLFVAVIIHLACFIRSNATNHNQKRKRPASADGEPLKRLK